MPGYVYRNGLARRGDRYHYRFRFRGQTYQGSTGLTRLADAVLWLRRYQDQLANGEVGLATPPSLKAAWEHWQQTQKGKASEAHLQRAERAFRLHILPVCGELRVDQINNEVVELIRTRYLEGKSNRTRRKGKDGKELPALPRTKQGANTILAYLKAIIRPMVKPGGLKALPFKVRPLKPQTPVRSYVPIEKVPEFLAEVDRTKNEHVSIAIRAMLYMGLRESEALGMRWEWFQGDLETYTPGATKGREALPLPVHPDLRERLRALTALSSWVLPAKRKKAADPVLPHRAQFTVKAIKRAGLKIGVANLSPHRLRGTCATLMAKAGVNPIYIQRQLRHKDIQTTLRYVEVGLADLESAARKTWSPG